MLTQPLHLLMYFLVTMMPMRMARVMNVILMQTMMVFKMKRITVGSNSILNNWTKMVSVEIILVNVNVNILNFR